MMNREPGFTTTELLIVICLISTLTGIATLSYLSMRPGLRLNGATRQVVGELMAARMKAVNQNNEFKVFFLNDHEYKILDDDDGDGTADAGEESETRNIQTHYPDVTFSSTGNPIFSSRGTASSLATIALTNTGGSKSISIGITGRVKIN